MIDPLSISASIVALLQLTGNVIKYLNGVRNASDDLKRLSLELCTLHGLLSTLKDVLNDLDPSLLDLLDGPDGIFAQLESLLEQLASIACEKSKRLHWPLQKSDVKDLLSSLERQKSSLSLILQNNHRAVSEEMNIGISNLRQDVSVFKTALHDAKNSRILRWLAAPDPSSNHNAACATHSPTTGDWLLTSDSFKSWWENPHESLWIYGLPGCGKSVLASTIIEHASDLGEEKPHRRLLYFYFDFREEAKQTVDGFLRPMLVQLSCIGSDFPHELLDLYSQLESKQQQPTCSDLSHTFFSILERCQQMYLVVDALDECSTKYSPEREGMLMLLNEIMDKETLSVNTLVLSRQEQDIADRLQHITTQCVCIQNDCVDADIRVHVRRLLASDSRLRNKSQPIKEEIEKTLVDGAHGMFRWVVCQIDVLRQCRRISILRDALKTLPETLDITYDRILSSISKQDRKDAIAALQFLAVSTCAVSVADVAEAVVVDRDSCCFDRDDRLPNDFDIVDVLSSLVTCSSRQIPMRANERLSGRYAGAELATEVRLAHYSVEEYILSDRVRQGTVPYFYISPYEAQKSVAEMCLIYLLQFDQEDFVSSKTIRDYPFCLYAAEYSFQHAKAAYGYPDHANDVNSNLTLLSVRLLCQDSPSFVNWLRLCDPCKPRQGASDKRTRDNMNSPMYYACYLGLLEVVRSLNDKGADVAKHAVIGRTMSRRPLNGATLGKNEQVVSFLIQSGVDVNSATDRGKTALHQAGFFGLDSIVELLIRNGAQLELKTGPVAQYSQVRDPVRPVIEECNPTRNHTRRAEISIALEKYLLEKQMYLESNSFAIPPVEDRQVLGHGYVLAALMYGGDRAEVESATGWTALHDAAWSGRVGVIRLLLNHGADGECRTRYGWTPLLLAVWNAHTAVVREFLNRGAILNVRNVYGWTPLHAASARGHESIVRMLLDRGADIEAETSYGWTPLFSAVREEHVKTLMLLLERGANPDANNSYGGTALHRAARAGSKSSVSLLLQSGASRSIRSIYGTTAMKEAEFHGHDSIIQLFNTIPERGTETIKDRQGPVSQTLPQQTSPLEQPLMDSSESDKVESPRGDSKLLFDTNNADPPSIRHDRGDGTALVGLGAFRKPISILFVCRSNLCRSPLAEAVFRSLTKFNPRYGQIDSAGTAAYHGVEYPEPEIMTALRDHGIVEYEHVMRKIQGKHFAIFDYILTVGIESLRQLQQFPFRTVEASIVEMQGCQLAKLALFGYFVREGVKSGGVENFPHKPPSSFGQTCQGVIKYSETFIRQVLNDSEKSLKLRKSLGHAFTQQDAQNIRTVIVEGIWGRA